MKVLFVGPYDAKGRYKGGIASLLNGTLECKEEFYRYNIEPVAFDTCRIKRDNKTDGKIKYENIVNFIKIYNDIVKTVEKEKADVVYYHSSIGIALLKDLIVLHRIKRKTKAKAIIHIHAADYTHIMTGIKLVDHILYKLLVNTPDRIIFLSRATAEDYINRGLSRKKVHVIYNYGTLDCTDNEIEEKKNRSNKKLEFLFMGSIEPMKGIFDLIDALQKSDSEWKLHVCGACADNKSEVKFNNYLNSLGDRVIFHGFVTGKEKRDIFLQSDVLALPSYAEGMPVVILEAYQTGCAVISTTVGAIPEIVKEENGWLVQPGDVEALTSKLNEAIASPQILRKMQEHNYIESEKYSVNSFIRQMADVCNEV